MPSTSVWAIVVDPSSPATVYAGTQTMGVYKSTNAGTAWTPVNNGLLPAGGNRQLRALAIDPAATGTLYATTDGGVFKTVDGGAVWTASNGGLTNLSAQAIAVDPRAPSTVYIGVTFNGVQKSVDGGATWTPARTGLTSEVSSLAIDPRVPARVYAGTQVGIFATSNGGQGWATANAGLANAVVQSVAVDPAVPTTLYVGTRYSGAHKSVDGGATWTAINAGLSGSDVRVLTIDPSLPSRIYAGTGSGLYRSTDSGATWTSIEHGTLIRNISAIVVDPRTPTTLRVGTFFTGVFVSTDGGETWSTDNAGLPATPSVSGLAYGAGQLVASTPSNGMFIADAPGASAAAGGASTWRGFMIGMPPDLLLVVMIFLFIVPMGYLVLAGASSGSPLGAVWMALTGAATMDSAVMGAVPPGTWQALPAPTGVSPSACTPVKTATGVHGASMFYVGGGCGVLAVTDSATKVTAMNAGMPTGLQVNALAITPSGGDLYAGTEGGSVFRYTASGAAAGVQVVEYYNAALDHYFITWVAAEQANLDAGNTPTRWTRTGQSFRAYAMAQGGTSAGVPVLHSAEPRRFALLRAGHRGMRGDGSEQSELRARRRELHARRAARRRCRVRRTRRPGVSRVQQSPRCESSVPDRPGAARPDGGQRLARGRRRPRRRRHVRAVVTAPRALTAAPAWPSRGVATRRFEFRRAEFRPAGQGTELLLTHRRFADTAARDRHHEGWIGCLDRFGRHLAR